MNVKTIKAEQTKEVEDWRSRGWHEKSCPTPNPISLITSKQGLLYLSTTTFLLSIFYRWDSHLVILAQN